MRIFNTYGPSMRLNDGRVLPAFIGQALRWEPLTVFGDGSQTRSLRVDDFIEGIVRLHFSDETRPVNIRAIRMRFPSPRLLRKSWP